MRPDNAAFIWADNNILHVELPDPASGKSHIIRLPLNVYGLGQVVEVLKHRHNSSKIGTTGDPTQHQVEENIRLAKGYKGPIKKPLAKVALTPQLSASIKEIMRKVGIGT